MFNGYLHAQIFPSRDKPNPDGDRPSLHITPYFTGGEFSYKSHAPLINGNIPLDTENLIFKTPYDLNFGLHVLLKFPLNNNLTISPFFVNETYNYGVIVDQVQNNAKKLEINYTTKEYKGGATISIYF
jgi:hypothetical protein